MALRDGTKLPIPACQYPPYLRARQNVGHRSVGSVPDYDDWIEWVEASLQYDWFTKLTATWHVPTAPSVQYSSSPQPQAYYAFPGLENGYVVIQPVIQYGWNQKYGGGNYWSAASWLCDNVGYYCFYSPQHIDSLQVGDSVVGDIVASRCDNEGRCDWTITTTDVNLGRSTTLFLNKDTADFNFAYTSGTAGAVEVYNLTSCAHFPSNGIFFTGLKVYNRYGSQFAPTWNDRLGTYTTPSCGFGASHREVASGVFAVNLFHNPGPQPEPPTPSVYASIAGPELVPANAYCTWIGGASGGTEPYVFQWTLNGDEVTDTTGTLSVVTPASDFYITMVAVDANGLANGMDVFVDTGSVNSCDPERRSNVRAALGRPHRR